MCRSALVSYADESFQQAAGDTWRPGGLELTRHALGICQFRQGASILDIGCGKGATLLLLRDLGFSGTGLDKTRHVPLDVPFVQGDASAPPFAAASFDGLICECVLSLLPRPDEAIKKFAVLLKEGGRLIMTDVYLRSGPERCSGKASSSCLDGARRRPSIEQGLASAGFRILTFEDHSEELKRFAATLIWYGSMPRCCLTPHGEAGLRYGYGMWIAELPVPHALP